MAARFLSAVIVHSQNPQALADFYQRILGLPFKATDHNEELHFECELADTHFAIFEDRSPQEGRNRITLAFAIDDMCEFLHKLRSEHVGVTAGPIEHGFGILVSILDCDGNHVDVTQLSTSWLAYLRDKKS